MTHILIIWSNALEKKDEILHDLHASFSVMRVIRIHWDKEAFMKNLFIFYAHSQRHLNETQYKKLLKNKINHCGDKDFYLVVFEDNNPHMEIRQTSSGPALVNVNVFDKKDEYRKLTGGGHKIHTSNDEWETNKDLTVLFGKNTNDFVEWLKSDNLNDYNNNCIGVKGFESISQLFYLLNNTIKYCVLRNHECLPEKNAVDNHGDIDLLVEDRNYIKYLTLAHNVYNIAYRVYHVICIAGKDIPFDFRYVGDNYYDKGWEEEILERRQLLPKGIYVPNDEDQFYTLLYHAYIQKRTIADDYITKLSFYSNKISVNYNPSTSASISLLDEFMKQNNYEYIKPKDTTVFFNLQSLQLSSYAFRHGIVVSKNGKYDPQQVPFFSVVYDKEQSFYKRASDFLIKNEVHFLEELEKHEYFPRLLDNGVKSDGAYLETEKLEGEDFLTFFSSKEHLHFSFIKSFIEECVKILRILTDNKIIHCDFIGQNLLIKQEGNVCKVSLIDFGWAIHKNEYNKMLRPRVLGCNYSPKEGVSDLYTFAQTIKEMWPNIHYIKRIHEQMAKNVFNGQDDTQECFQLLDNVEKLLNNRINQLDRYHIFELRHKRFLRFRRKYTSLLKRIR